jgi:hypothetical protein
METNVLLCCINPCPLAKPIEDRDLFFLFSHFGRVCNALIFSQKVQIKAFIEFAKAADLEVALTGIPLMNFPFGRVRVYRSKKENVDRKMQFRFKRKTSVQSEDLQSRDIGSAQEFQPEGLQLKTPSAGPKVQSLSGVSVAVSSSLHQSHPAPVCEKDYHSTSTESISGNSKAKEIVTSERERTAVESKSQPVACASRPKVIIINGVNFGIIKGKILLNFYSCFGNIVKMLLNKEQSYALIEFESEAQACCAISFTKNLFYFGSALRIKMSKYTSLNFKSLDNEKNDNLAHFHGNSKLYRHPKNVVLDRNPLSTTVTFTEVPESVDEVVLFALVSQVHQPITITKLTPLDRSALKMYIVKFSDELQAAEVLSAFHNKKVDSNFLKVSFAASA